MTRFRTIFLVVFFILIGTGFYTLMNSTTYQVFGKIFPKVNYKEKVVALTFDDGPTPRTDSILTILSRHHVKATFFIVGKYLENHPEFGTSIVRAGHQLANHSYQHKRMLFKSFNFISDEIEKTSKLIRKAGFTDEILFRPPYGKKLFLLPYYLEQHQMKTIMWNIAPETFTGNPLTAKEINQIVNEQIAPGSIILLHPMNGPKSSLDAISLIIESLQSKGYQFVTMSQLLKLHNK